MNATKRNAWLNSDTYKAGLVKAKARMITRMQKIATSTKSSKEDVRKAQEFLKTVE